MSSNPEHISALLERFFRHSRERAAKAEAAAPEIKAAINAIQDRNWDALDSGKVRHLGSVGVPESILAAVRVGPPKQTFAYATVQADWRPDEKPFLLLSGGAGSGKSFAAAWSLLRARKKSSVMPHPLADEPVEFEEYDRHAGLFITAAQLHYATRFNQDSRDTPLLDRAATVKWLVLDELRAADFKGAGSERLEEVLGERYARRLPTVITTNLAQSELRPLLGERLASRFAEGCMAVDCGDADLRRAK